MRCARRSVRPFYSRVFTMFASLRCPWIMLHGAYFLSRSPPHARHTTHQRTAARAPLTRVTGDLKSEVTHVNSFMGMLYTIRVRSRTGGRLEMDIVHELARGVPAHEVLVRHPVMPARLRLAWADFRLACVPLGLRAFRVLHLQQRVRLCLVR